MDKSGTEDIRILIVDSHRLFGAGLRALVEKEPGLTIAGQAVNRTEALESVRSRPDIILLELDLGAESGLDLLPDLFRSAEGAPVLIVTAVLDFELHLQAVRLGARGVVLKNESASTLFKAIRKVNLGEAWVNRSMLASVISDLHKNGIEKPNPEKVKIARLTARERDVVALVGEGRKNRAMGEQLFISEATVRHHLTSIFEKLEVSDRLELMIYAYKNGLTSIPTLTNSEDNRSNNRARATNRE